jgi:hypothetical protein
MQNIECGMETTKMRQYLQDAWRHKNDGASVASLTGSLNSLFKNGAFSVAKLTAYAAGEGQRQQQSAIAALAVPAQAGEAAAAAEEEHSSESADSQSDADDAEGVSAGRKRAAASRAFAIRYKSRVYRRKSNAASNAHARVLGSCAAMDARRASLFQRLLPTTSTQKYKFGSTAGPMSFELIRRKVAAEI